LQSANIHQLILSQQLNNSELTVEYLNNFTPGKIGVAGRKYDVRTYTVNILPVNFNILIIISEF
jgi:hypothetical protein